MVQGIIETLTKARTDPASVSVTAMVHASRWLMRVFSIAIGLCFVLGAFVHPRFSVNAKILLAAGLLLVVLVAYFISLNISSFLIKRFWPKQNAQPGAAVDAGTSPSGG
jgi:hypothetical protein